MPETAPEISFQDWLVDQDRSRGFTALWTEWVMQYGTRSQGSTPIARMRRGKRVLIPAEWRGKVTDPSTIRKRQSKQPRKVRNASRRRIINGAYQNPRERMEARAPTIEEFDG